MTSTNMRIISVPSDGDCLYHAFIKGIGIPGLEPQQLRDFVANKILAEKDLYEDLVTEWADFNVIQTVESIDQETAANHLRTSKEWATSTVIHILATAFNVRVIVFQKINDKFFSETFPSEWKIENNDPEKNPMTKPYKDIYLIRRGYHFELLIPDGVTTETRGFCIRSGDGGKNNKNLRRGLRGGAIVDDNDGNKWNMSTIIMGVAGVLLMMII